jgi:hypothetical protein
MKPDDPRRPYLKRKAGRGLARLISLIEADLGADPERFPEDCLEHHALVYLRKLEQWFRSNDDQRVDRQSMEYRAHVAEGARQRRAVREGAKRNQQGLTWAEWLAASGRGTYLPESTETRRLISLWRLGTDPISSEREHEAR